ncbi:MAG TPA: helix-turn-helix domain-containing protein, partial [Gemmataceae bacterium]|nr:helix-turn-helix domain-containing protein [Gemmataceae bacterium]
GPNSGRRPNVRRRRDVTSLHARGVAPPEIARRLGIGVAAVYYYLKAHGVPDRRPGACAVCRAAIVSNANPHQYTDLLCRDCLQKNPQISFARFLKSLRVTAGMSRQDLAARGTIGLDLIGRYERGEVEPAWKNLMRLFKAFGVRLLVPQESRGG